MMAFWGRWQDEDDDGCRTYGDVYLCCIGGFCVLEDKQQAKQMATITHRVESENGIHPEAWYKAFKEWISCKGANRRAALFLADDWLRWWCRRRFGSKFAFYPNATEQHVWQKTLCLRQLGAASEDGDSSLLLAVSSCPIITLER